MCGECRVKAGDYILDLVNSGYDLDIATLLVRDIIVRRGLMDRGAMGIETIEDVQALSDDVTEAGDVLAECRQQSESAFTLLLWERALQVIGRKAES